MTTGRATSARAGTALYVLTLALLGVVTAGLLVFTGYAGTAAGGWDSTGLSGTLVLLLWTPAPLVALLAGTVWTRRHLPRALPAVTLGSVVAACPVVSSTTYYFARPEVDRNAIGLVALPLLLWLVVGATALAAAATETLLRGRSGPRPTGVTAQGRSGAPRT